MESHIDRQTDQQPIPPPSLAISGDCEALNNLLGSQRRRLYRAALRLLGHSEDAEDAVQDGLLAAFRNIHQFEGRAQLSTWLTRIVINAALMRRRTLHAHEWEPIDELLMQQGSLRLSDTLIDGRPNPEEVYARTEQRRILDRGLECLSQPQRRVLSLHDFQGMPVKEVANALGLSEGTVKSQVSRARRKLSRQVRKLHESRAFRNFGSGVT